MPETSQLSCAVALLKDLYLLIASNEYGCKELVLKKSRYAGAEGFLVQTVQFKCYCEFNRKPTKLME